MLYALKSIYSDISGDFIIIAAINLTYCIFGSIVLIISKSVSAFLYSQKMDGTNNDFEGCIKILSQVTDLYVKFIKQD